MQQLTQKLGSGDMIIQEVPYPQLGKGMVIVKNHYSIISAGTEGSTVVAARKSLLGKAKERPKQVHQVLDSLKKQGPLQTYRAVMKKLDAYSPLGYSCSGEVIEVGEGVSEFSVGDMVACAGAGYANHAEVVSVPVNLCVKLDKNANLKDAAYNTLGAISMQGVRQANLRLGESCVVIGLGLLGQLAALILKASGVTVIGVDVSESAVQQAIENNVVDVGFNRNISAIEDEIKNLTQGFGADAIIISAATESIDPINFAGAIARKRGTVVVLGAIPTGFDRDPHWYRKELQLKMACSYGPGRYDLNYEEKGIDYPLPYVRWTEKRNMMAFQNLLTTKKINIDYITTHIFDFSSATDAFDLVVSKSEPFTGIALKYKSEKKARKTKILTSDTKKLAKINISFIGAGSYAQGNLLPYIPKDSGICKIGVLTNSGTTSKRVAEKYGFQFCASKEKDVLDQKTNTVFIATRHDSHATYVIKSLKSNKNVFVEKPLCILESELNEIIKLKSKSNQSIMVGFNRRFSPLTQKMKQVFSNGPMTMLYRINAGSIPYDNWIQDLSIGGGRILGEVCHFIDYLTYLNGSRPCKISANSIPDSKNLNDSLNILITFENGSSGVIGYYSNGSKAMPKEYVEVFSSGQSAILSDFKKLEIFDKGKKKKNKLFNQNKGQKEMVRAFLNSLLNNSEIPISFDDIVAVTKASFKVIESIKNGGKQITI